MRRILIITTLVLAISAASFAVDARIESVTGSVQILNGDGVWEQGAAGMVVQSGYTIATGFNSTASVSMGDSTLIVSPVSRLTIDELTRVNGTISTDLFLHLGRVRAEVHSAEGLKNDFRLRSTASTASVRGTEFEYDGKNLYVDEGDVALTNLIGQAHSVREGQQSSAYRFEPIESVTARFEERSTADMSVDPLLN